MIGGGNVHKNNGERCNAVANGPKHCITFDSAHQNQISHAPYVLIIVSTSTNVSGVHRVRGQRLT
jgi:hypothetical protein